MMIRKRANQGMILNLDGMDGMRIGGGGGGTIIWNLRAISLRSYYQLSYVSVWLT